MSVKEDLQFKVTMFKHGFRHQVESAETLEIGVAAGLVQGLKYKGSVKNGLTAGFGVVAVLGVINGARTAIKGRDVGVLTLRGDK